MASDSLPEQRTEMPTERRMGELRKEGALFHSQDLEHFLVLLTGFLLLSWTWQNIFNDMKYVLVRSFTMIGDVGGGRLEVNDLTNGFIRLLFLLLPDILIMTACVGAMAALAVFLQTKWNKRPKWIKFNWRFLNPITGLKRIISIAGFVNFLKSFAKFVLVSPIAYYALKEFAPQMIQLVHMTIPDVMGLTGKAIGKVFWKVAYVFLALAAIDYGYGKWSWLRQNKMTKDEVKDERKAIEGDETTKRKMVAKGLQRAAQRLRQTVPTADVIVTNPTHFAVALKYDKKSNAAPIVVAKGTEFLALQIREIAKEHNIPILERKALARALYSSTEVGSEIPRDLFRAVAEVLAYVYRLKTPYRGARVQQ
jgi:flagellar biosynthetic protein FlhB